MKTKAKLGRSNLSTGSPRIFSDRTRTFLILPTHTSLFNPRGFQGEIGAKFRKVQLPENLKPPFLLSATLVFNKTFFFNTAKIHADAGPNADLIKNEI